MHLCHVGGWGGTYVAVREGHSTVSSLLLSHGFLASNSSVHACTAGASTHQPVLHFLSMNTIGPADSWSFLCDFPTMLDCKLKLWAILNSFFSDFLLSNYFTVMGRESKTTTTPPYTHTGERGRDHKSYERFMRTKENLKRWTLSSLTKHHCLGCGVHSIWSWYPSSHSL